MYSTATAYMHMEIFMVHTTQARTQYLIWKKGKFPKRKNLPVGKNLKAQKLSSKKTADEPTKKKKWQKIPPKATTKSPR